MTSTNIPVWFETLEDSPVRDWLDDDEFPFDTAENMIAYLSKHDVDALKRLLVDDSNIPQSFVHWWCHVRVARRDGPERPVYSCLESWLPVVARWKKSDCQPTDVIGTFKVWMDLLFVDITVYDDENQRPNVPRLKNGAIHWRKRPKKTTLEKTRKDTLQFIMDQGHEIFRERGWIEGQLYWKSQCKKYSVLFT